MDTYFTLGIGRGSLEASPLTSSRAAGTQLNIGIGFRGPFLGSEIGFNGDAYDLGMQDNTIDAHIFGLSWDLKLQPTIGRVEPYALAGLGGYHVRNAVEDASMAGGALRLGFGLDYRFSQNFALSGRALWSHYALAGQANSMPSNPSTRSFGINASFYF